MSIQRHRDANQGDMAELEFTAMWGFNDDEINLDEINLDDRL